MTRHDVIHSRLVNQQITDFRSKTPQQIVAAFGAMQAQDYLGALWAIGLRLTGATEADIERAIADRTIVRTWPMRGTLHFVAAADVRWLLELLTPRVIAGSALRHQRYGLDDRTIARCKKLLVNALKGGNRLSRDQLYAVLERANITTADQRGYHILWRLAHDGLICFGPRLGKTATFTLLEEWVSETRSMDRDQALGELAHRYFDSHGPATLPDFIWWSGLKAVDAKAGLDLASPQLTQEKIGNKIYWMPSRKMGSRKRGAHLLRGFDEWLLGYNDRTHTLDPQHSQQITPGNGAFTPTILLDGRVIGTWRCVLKKNEIAITLRSFAPMSAPEERAVKAAAERYGRYLGTENTRIELAGR